MIAISDSGAQQLFGPWETVIESWSDFQSQANELTMRYPERALVWRGARRAEWGVMSSLYRALFDILGVPPTEDQMNEAELRILDRARHDWRFDGMPALETMAHLQHFGGPTRLLDVSVNPLIALWFAVESRATDNQTDARLLAFVASSPVHLNRNWHGYHLHWHELDSHSARVTAKWGTGLGRRLWMPPAFNSRISSQNAGFLIDGVPIDAPDSGIGRLAPEIEASWTAEEMCHVSSIPLKITQIRRGELPASHAPVFTFRIAADAKKGIRGQLEQRYGYRASSIYSDMSGLAENLRLDPQSLL